MEKEKVLEIEIKKEDRRFGGRRWVRSKENRIFFAYARDIFFRRYKLRNLRKYNNRGELRWQHRNKK